MKNGKMQQQKIKSLALGHTIMARDLKLNLPPSSLISYFLSTSLPYHTSDGGRRARDGPPPRKRY